MSGLTAHLDIGNVTLRLALTYVLEHAGHRRARDATTADAVVADRTGLGRASRPLDALVIDPTPAACQDALDAVLRGAARTVVVSDDPEGLVDALESAAAGTVSIPARIVEQANRAPRLPERLAHTLELVVAGYTNPQLARRLYQSESTVKRDINALLTHFGVANRLALVGAARAAGYAGPAVVLEAIAR